MERLVDLDSELLQWPIPYWCLVRTYFIDKVVTRFYHFYLQKAEAMRDQMFIICNSILRYNKDQKNHTWEVVGQMRESRLNHAVVVFVSLDL